MQEKNKSNHSHRRSPARKRHEHRLVAHLRPEPRRGVRGLAESGERVVGAYPFLAVLASFGLGVTVGAAIGSMLIESPKPRWYDRIPEALGRRWVEGLMQSLPEPMRETIS